MEVKSIKLCINQLFNKIYILQNPQNGIKLCFEIHRNYIKIQNDISTKSKQFVSQFFKKLHLYSIRILIYMFLNQLISFKIKKTPSKT